MHLLLQPTYQPSQKVIIEQRTSPIFNSSGSSGGYHGSLPRNNSNSSTTNTGNLSELDTLLQDLSSARYGANLEKRGGTTSPSQTFLNDSIKRPSVDSLLDELSNAHNSGPIYAVPNGCVFRHKVLTIFNIYFQFLLKSYLLINSKNFNTSFKITGW